MTTAVIILSWNSKKDLTDCLQSVLAQELPTSDYKVLVVDNASQDGSADFVEQNFPQVSLLRSQTNKHFTGGNNLGIEFARSEWDPEFIAILNPDTIVPTNWLSAQLKIMQHKPEVGVIGPKVVFAPGFGPEGKTSSPENLIINSAGIHQGGFLFPYDIGFDEPDNGQYDQAHEVYAVTGTSMLIRAAALTKLQEQGRKDAFFEPFKAYLEEVDLCIRIRSAGYKVIYTPTTHVLHKHMQSAQKRSGYYDFLSRRNYLLLVYRHYPLRKLARAVWQNLREIPFPLFMRTLFAFVSMPKR